MVVKKLKNIFNKATDFGTLRSRENFFSFALKCLFYIIPAILIGGYTDISIQIIRKNNVLGTNVLFYILLHTLIIIITLYLILLLPNNYTNEFQISIAGGFFIVLYFGIQTNYMKMIKESINSQLNLL